MVTPIPTNSKQSSQLPNGHQPTLLVTGGAGFIGSNFIHLALHSGYKIVNIDRLTYAANLSSLNNIPHPENYQFFQTDILQTESVAELLKKFRPDGLFHFAAESHVDRSIGAPGNFVQTNIVGTYSLLEASKEYSESNEKFRFIHVSTDEVFGDVSAPHFSKEGDPYLPNSPYSASKASSDHLVRSYFQTYQFPAITTNCSNNFGPRQHPEKLIPKVIIRGLQGKEIPIYGDGTQQRDWIHVEDHCRGLLRVFERGVIGESYNIGAKCLKPNLEIAKRLCQILDQLSPKDGLDRQSLIRHVQDRAGHDSRYALENSKMLELRWSPQHDFDSSLLATAKWYLENRDWVKSFESPGNP